MVDSSVVSRPECADAPFGAGVLLAEANKPARGGTASSVLRVPGFAVLLPPCSRFPVPLFLFTDSRFPVPPFLFPGSRFPVSLFFFPRVPGPRSRLLLFPCSVFPVPPFSFSPATGYGLPCFAWGYAGLRRLPLLPHSRQAPRTHSSWTSSRSEGRRGLSRPIWRWTLSAHWSMDSTMAWSNCVPALSARIRRASGTDFASR